MVADIMGFWTGLVAALLFCNSTAFAPTHGVPKYTVLGASKDPQQNNNNDDAFDADAARRQLEGLLDDDDDTVKKAPKFSLNDLLDLVNDKTGNVQLPTAPPMTSIDRNRRALEVNLLQELQQSDEAQSALWDLWFGERGAMASRQLKSADQFMITNPKHAQQLLESLLQEYGVFFCEPINRLATLYYLQGDFKTSYKLCLIVLKLKPWHFGAQSGIVLVLQKLGDRDHARQRAELRLPELVANTSFPPFEKSNGAFNPQRAEWVRRAVRDAESALEDAEERTKTTLGRPETYYVQERTDAVGDVDGNDTDDSWQ